MSLLPRLPACAALFALVVYSAPASAQTVIGEVFSSDANLQGSVLLTAGGTQVLSGSSVTAGTSPARLKLARGGEVRVCSGSQVGLNASASGRDLMLSLNSGSVELHYRLDASADSLLTPDFRLMLAGPGEFHLAVAADAKGNTCMRALPGTTAAVIVNEQFGDAVYQLRPGDEVLFRQGKISDRAPLDEPCGCPPPPPVQQLAKAAEPAPEPPPLAAPKPENSAPVATSATPAPAPPPANGAVQVQVDAPFVFRADEPPDPLMYASIRLEHPAAQNMWPTIAPPPAPAELAAEPPKLQPEKPKKKKRNWFKAFFAAIFGG